MNKISQPNNAPKGPLDFRAIPWFFFVFLQKSFFSLIHILAARLTAEKFPLSYILVRHIYTEYFFVGDFPTIFEGMAPKILKIHKMVYFLKFLVQSIDFWGGSSLTSH